MDSVRVLTIDDHEAFRDAALALISATDGFESVGEVATGEEGVAAARRLQPDLVLVDVHLPDISGYEASLRIELLDPDAVIVLVSAAEDALQGDIAARCGASVYVRKEDLRPSLIQSIWARHGKRASRPEHIAAVE